MNRRTLTAIAVVAALAALGLAVSFWMEDSVENPLSFRVLELAPGENGEVYLKYEARNESRFPVEGVFLMKLEAWDGSSEQTVGSSDYGGPGRLHHGESFTDWMHGDGLRHLPDAGNLSFMYQWTPVTRGRLRKWLRDWAYAGERPAWVTRLAYDLFYPKEGRTHPVIFAPGVEAPADRSSR